MNELETIIKLHENLIYKIATRFYNAPLEDLYQAGVMGLIKAYHNFVDNGKTKFATYAYNYIYGEMYELVNNTRSIKLNKNILKLYKKIEQTKYLLAQKQGYMPTPQELSKYLGIDELTIEQIYLTTNTIMSLDSEEENNITDRIYNPKDNINTNNIDLNDSLSTLSQEEQDIIKYRYFNDFTQNETAKLLGLSQVTVSRYEKKSLTKMYNYLNT